MPTLPHAFARSVASDVRLSLKAVTTATAVLAFVPDGALTRRALRHKFAAAFWAVMAMRHTGIRDVFGEFAVAVWAYREELCFSHEGTPVKVNDTQVASLRGQYTQTGFTLTQQGGLA